MSVIVVTELYTALLKSFGVPISWITSGKMVWPWYANNMVENACVALNPSDVAGNPTVVLLLLLLLLLLPEPTPAAVPAPAPSGGGCEVDMRVCHACGDPRPPV